MCDCGHEVAIADPDEDVPRITPNPKALNAANALLCVGILGMILGPLRSLVLTIVSGIIALAGYVLLKSQPYRCGNCGCDVTRWSKSCRLCGATFAFTVR